MFIRTEMVGATVRRNEVPVPEDQKYIYRLIKRDFTGPGSLHHRLQIMGSFVSFVKLWAESC